MNEKKAIALQRAYYTETAGRYNSMHVSGNADEGHNLACSLLSELARLCHVKSILDIGSGTGRVILSLQETLPDVHIQGIEPVAALREIGYESGISRNRLLEGDATQLQYADESFDFVCAFGTLHHIPAPKLAVAEMLRVAKKGIFISDGNRFAQGSYLERLIKLFCYKMKLWPLANYIKTKGKGYAVSDGDGITYSYSVFDDYNEIQKQCKKIMLFNIEGGGKKMITDASHVGLFGIK